MSANSRFSNSAQALQAQAQTALQSGRRAEAIALLRRAINDEPNHIASRLWLAGLCADPQESLKHLAHVLTLEPQNAAAREGIRWARKRLGLEETAPAEPAPFVKRIQSTPLKTSEVEVAIQPKQTAAQNVVTVASDESATPATVGSVAIQTVSPPIPSPLNPKATRLRAQRQQLRARRWTSADVFTWSTSAVVAVACLLLLVGSVSAIAWVLYQVSRTEAAPLPPPAQLEDPLPLPLPPAVAVPTPIGPTRQERADTLLREVDIHWAKSDWEQVIPRVAQVAAFRPDDPNMRQKLMSAYFNHAETLIDAGELERALGAFDQALDVMPNEPQARVERDTLANYIIGQRQFTQGQWSEAIQTLQKVSRNDSGYLDTREMLYRAYYNYGLALKQQKDLEGALKAFQAAVDIDTTGLEAREELGIVKAALAPPPPPPPGESGEKWIDVNLTTQRFRAYEGKKLIWEFKTSTGENARPTQPGRYQVLDKIPMAYSRFWNLWMPYWMGIYWAGASENGIHALPILKNGQTLWGGFLGRRVSFGCVILDTKAAKMVYDWAEIGTPVIIHY